MSEQSHSPVVKPMSAHDALHDRDNHGFDTHEDHGGLGKYITVFFALCGLTLMSFWTNTPLWPFPGEQNHKITWTFMMAVSCTKAMLVILFFMHVKYEANWKYVLTIPAGMMSIFLVLMLIPDVAMRNKTASQERQLFTAVKSDQDSRNHHGGGAGHGHGESQK
jgi:cytochrome c oxidase subunit IV